MKLFYNYLISNYTQSNTTYTQLLLIYNNLFNHSHDTVFIDQFDLLLHYFNVKKMVTIFYKYILEDKVYWYLLVV